MFFSSFSRHFSPLHHPILRLPSISRHTFLPQLVMGLPGPSPSQRSLAGDFDLAASPVFGVQEKIIEDVANCDLPILWFCLAKNSVPIIPCAKKPQPLSVPWWWCCGRLEQKRPASKPWIFSELSDSSQVDNVSTTSQEAAQQRINWSRAVLSNVVPQYCWYTISWVTGHWSEKQPQQKLSMWQILRRPCVQAKAHKTVTTTIRGLLQRYPQILNSACSNEQRQAFQDPLWSCKNLHYCKFQENTSPISGL